MRPRGRVVVKFSPSQIIPHRVVRGRSADEILRDCIVYVEHEVVSAYLRQECMEFVKRSMPANALLVRLHWTWPWVDRAGEEGILIDIMM